MHKTIYINTNEEIIGIINKIREEDVQEIFLVIPKNSLLTQGVINLKLLKKEVAKMHKKIILVTSDKHSKRIIKRVGLETRNKLVEDFVKDEIASTENSNLKISESKSLENLDRTSQKREFGSSNFYSDHHPETSTKKKVLPKKIEEDQNSIKSENKNLRIRTTNTFGKEHIENHKSKKNLELTDETLESEGEFKINPNFEQTKINQQEKVTIDDFYREDIICKKPSSTNNPIAKRGRFKLSNKKKLWGALGVFFSILIVFFGFWIFSNYPKMKVELFLKEKVANASIDLLICDKKTVLDNCLAGTYQDLLIEVSEKYDSSGEKFSNDKGMARGIVKISNNYSSNQQPLVATTRLLSKEGKLFRLVKSVTVPGMDGENSGMIEAQIIADEIGQEYNIKATEFTIEGFKGGEKYEKFKVVSEQSITGGANDIENKKVKVVTEQDINTAREKTIESFNQNLKENIVKRLTNEETFVLTSAGKEIVYSDSSYAPGDIIDEFSYTIRERVELISFDKKSFENTIRNAFEENSQKDLDFSKLVKTDFRKDIADYETKKLSLSIDASALYWPILNNNELKKELSSKNNAELKKLLTDFDKIKKAVIFYSPSWLSNFPIKNKNITIKKRRE